MPPTRLSLPLSLFLLTPLVACKGITVTALDTHGSGVCAVRAIAAPRETKKPRSCDEATPGDAVETVFDKDVADGEQRFYVDSELGSVSVRRLTFNTSVQFDADPAEYEASYHYDEFSVALKFPDGGSIGGKGKTLDEALANARRNCKEGA